jgi:hypothetical protein
MRAVDTFERRGEYNGAARAMASAGLIRAPQLLPVESGEELA